MAASGRAAAAAAQFSQAAELWSDAAKAARAAEQAKVAPVAPPPPRAPPPAPAPPADPGQQIRSLFADYAAAIESRSVDAIRRPYPGLLPRQALDWQEFFRRVSDIQVELNVTDLKIAGDVADAQLEGVYVFTDPGTRRIQREKVSFQASLRQGPGRVANRVPALSGLRRCTRRRGSTARRVASRRD